MLQKIPLGILTERSGLLVFGVSSNGRSMYTRSAMLWYKAEEAKEASTLKVEEMAASRSTVDTSEIKLHGGLRDQWWNRSGEMKGLHSLNKLRVPFIRDSVMSTSPNLEIYRDTPTPLQGAKILDVGCGGGILTEPLSRLGATVTGLDASEELITLAKTHCKQSSLSNLTYTHNTIESFSELHREQFDAVVASEVIEHISDKQLFIESCVNSLRPGGSLLLTTLNKTTAGWLAGIVAAEYILNILPKGTHHWDKFISPQDLSKMLDKYDCKTKLIHGMCYVFINNEWYWTSNTAVNYAIHAVKKVQ